jgi:hypothetical protein
MCAECGCEVPAKTERTDVRDEKEPAVDDVEIKETTVV